MVLGNIAWKPARAAATLTGFLDAVTMVVDAMAVRLVFE